MNARKYSLSRFSLYLTIFIITFICYLLYIVYGVYFDINQQYSLTISVLSWLGYLILFYIIFTWYKITGKFFSLYSIFMLFFFLFNYGQPLMWALGIHQPNEIGQRNLYTLDIANSGSIVYTQLLTLISIMMFHLGAVFSYKKKASHVRNYFDVNKEVTLKAIFYTSIILSVVVIPITFYNSIYDLFYSQQHGYEALYYDENKSNIIIFNLIQRMFFPCVLGLLIGSQYNRIIMYVVYFIFSIYLMINLLAGDRGSWIYYIIILIFMSHTFYKKINWRQIFIGTILGVLFLHFVQVIVELRDGAGINPENIINSFLFENSPIVQFIFEMGDSMRPALVLIQYDWDIWPYLNSYILAFIGLIPSSLLEFLGIPFNSLGNWFSQEYLGISYGAGFSIVAEALINFGPILTPFIMIFIGYIVTSLTYLDKSFSIKENSLRILFAVSSMSVFVTLIRGHFYHTLSFWLYGVLFFVLIVILIKKYLLSKMGKRILAKEGK